MTLLSETGVLEYLSEHWEILHTQSRQWILEDIDEFIRNQAIKAYKDAVEMFAIHSTIENSLWCEEKAERLVNQFGFTWEQVEELEIATLKEIA